MAWNHQMLQLLCFYCKSKREKEVNFPALFRFVYLLSCLVPYTVSLFSLSSYTFLLLSHLHSVQLAKIKNLSPECDIIFPVRCLDCHKTSPTQELVFSSSTKSNLSSKDSLLFLFFGQFRFVIGNLWSSHLSWEHTAGLSSWIFKCTHKNMHQPERWTLQAKV